LPINSQKKKKKKKKKKKITPPPPPVCAILFAPIGAIGLLLVGVFWPPFNCLFSVWDAWWNDNRTNAIKFPAEAINVYWAFLRDFFQSGSLMR
jgi:hypothetical protein